MAKKETIVANPATSAVEDLFAPSVEVSTPQTKISEEWQPSAAKGKNNVYQAIVRFIPWYQDPKRGSIKDKWSCWLTDPITQKGKMIDCPSSVGKPSPLQDMYWKLKKSDNVVLQGKADIFSRKHAYASLIQVIKDDNNKDLEGKILIWKYGVKIWDKINAELNPVIGDKDDPFDIINGKAFAVVVTKVSGFNNYDQSKFVDKRIPLCIPNDEGKLIPINAKSDKKEVFDWVKENSPELNKFDYKEWDQDTHDYVNSVIVAVTGQASVPTRMANVVNSQKATPTGKPATPAQSGISSTDISIDDLDDMGTSDFPDLDLPSIEDLGSSLGDLDDLYKQA
jgi:hypothetical protein